MDVSAIHYSAEKSNIDNSAPSFTAHIRKELSRWEWVVFLYVMSASEPRQMDN